MNLLTLRNESNQGSGQDAALDGEGTSGSPLRSAVSRAVARYLKDMDDHANGDLFALLMAEVEAPMLAEVMRHCEGKQVRAAEVLGINRATLRKKLRQYGLA